MARWCLPEAEPEMGSEHRRKGGSPWKSPWEKRKGDMMAMAPSRPKSDPPDPTGSTQGSPPSGTSEGHLLTMAEARQREIPSWA